MNERMPVPHGSVPQVKLGLKGQPNSPVSPPLPGSPPDSVCLRQKSNFPSDTAKAARTRRHPPPPPAPAPPASESRAHGGCGEPRAGAESAARPTRTAGCDSPVWPPRARPGRARVGSLASTGREKEPGSPGAGGNAESRDGGGGPLAPRAPGFLPGARRPWGEGRVLRRAG